MKIMYIVALVLLCGVGFWKWQKDSEAKQAERAMEYQRMIAKQETEERQRAAMSVFADGMRKHCVDRRKVAEEEILDLRTDSRRLSAIVSEVMSQKDSKGGDLPYETKILQILTNGVVNALALKHLGADFLGVSAECRERILEARAAEEKYAAAVKSVDDAYSENMRMAGSWGKMSAEQRNAEISRLRSEISRLEARREREMKEYQNMSKLFIKGDVHIERERRARERVIVGRINDTENEISKKRSQIDCLRSPNEVNRIEAAAVERAQREQGRAASVRQSAMLDVDRRLKPKHSLFEVISEIEAKSVGRLKTALANKITECEKTVKSLSDKLAAVEEFALSIPVTDLQELMRRKAKFDK